MVLEWKVVYVLLLPESPTVSMIFETPIRTPAQSEAGDQRHLKLRLDSARIGMSSSGPGE